MNQILIDCERTKHPYTGLFYFCLHLGTALIRQADPAREKLTFYVPRTERSLFGPGHDYFFHRDFHKFWIPRTRSIRLGQFAWHDTAQRPPPKGKRRGLMLHDRIFLEEAEENRRKIKK